MFLFFWSLCSLSVFDRRLFLCFYSSGHCVVCPSLIEGFFFFLFFWSLCCLSVFDRRLFFVFLFFWSLCCLSVFDRRLFFVFLFFWSLCCLSVFDRRLFFVFLFFWSLCCLSVFDRRLLITLLVSPNYSFNNSKIKIRSFWNYCHPRQCYDYNYLYSCFLVVIVW